jgi:2-polyprenyl-6-methoxyphenol hydroxylase-like FAD-dependent oxidoreductase
MAESGRKAIIIGAGIGGLATAIGLHRAGWRVSLFEKATQLTPAGFGIGLTTNGLQALQHLGAYERVAEAGCQAEDAVVKDARGRVITTFDVKTIGRKTGVPTRMYHRADLQKALVSQLPPGCLEVDARCAGIDDSGGEAAVVFADGSRARADLVVGADGVHSTVRRILHGEDETRFATYVAWLAIMEVSHPVFTPGYNAHYWGAGARFGVHSTGGEQRYWWATKNKAMVPERLRNMHMVRCEENQADKAELVETFGDWADEVRHTIKVTPEERIFLVNTRDRKPLTWWGRGRVTLLGDAAHPMLTSLGQGGAMAFEDAAVLVRCLEVEPDVPRALATYERLRIPRTTSVVNATRRMSAIEQVSKPIGVRLRNTLFRYFPQSLLEKQLEQLSTFTMPAIGPAASTPRAEASGRAA